MTPPRIFYFAYSHNRPTGGQKLAYRHVDILNKDGFEAFIFHPTDNFRLSWFENNTRVIGWSHFQKTHDPNTDYIVLPEDLSKKILDFPGKKVIFNQNLFYGFSVFGLQQASPYPYHSREVVAALTDSEHNAAHLQFAYPNLVVRHVFVGIERGVFRFRPLRKKKPQIACIAKEPLLIPTLYHMIQSRTVAGFNHGGTFRWIFLGNNSESETARILQESLLFVFSNVTEGLGLLPLEAMSCGCLLAAFRYGPLKETLPENMDYEYGDLLRMARFIEQVMNEFPDGLSRWERHVQLCQASVLRYSTQRQERSVLEAWKKILGGNS